MKVHFWRKTAVQPQKLLKKNCGRKFRPRNHFQKHLLSKICCGEHTSLYFLKKWDPIDKQFPWEFPNPRYLERISRTVHTNFLAQKKSPFRFKASFFSDFQEKKQLLLNHF